MLRSPDLKILTYALKCNGRTTLFTFVGARPRSHTPTPCMLSQQSIKGNFYQNTMALSQTESSKTTEQRNRPASNAQILYPNLTSELRNKSFPQYSKCGCDDPRQTSSYLDFHQQSILCATWRIPLIYCRLSVKMCPRLRNTTPFRMR